MNRIEGAKDNFINACMYYISSLQEQNVQDVKKEVAETIATSIKLSDMQKQYIQSQNVDCNKTINSLKDFITSIYNKQIPLNSNDFDIIIRSLSLLEKCIRD